MKYEELRTPSLLIDYDQFLRNCKTMADKADRLDLEFCPHVKTHKTIKGAEYQRNGRLFGITVSTLAEAWYYAENGFDSLTYAFPVTADKLPEIVDLMEITEEFRLVTDEADTIATIDAFGEENELEFDVFLKVNTGANRAGANPESERLIELAKQLISAKNINFVGIMAHGGHTYQAKNSAEAKELAKLEIQNIEKALVALKKENIEPEIISIGDTPGCSVLEDFGSVNEIRPGNYVFFDRTQVDIGTCTEDQVSAFVLTRVIARYPDRNTLLIDAGALALSKDLGATHVRKDQTYGKIMEDDSLQLTKLSQEHGIITSEKPINFEKYPVGSFLTIMPNHSCLTAALHEHFIVVQNMGDRKILDSWKPVRGW